MTTAVFRCELRNMSTKLDPDIIWISGYFPVCRSHENNATEHCPGQKGKQQQEILRGGGAWVECQLAQAIFQEIFLLYSHLGSQWHCTGGWQEKLQQSNVDVFCSPAVSSMTAGENNVMLHLRCQKWKSNVTIYSLGQSQIICLVLVFTDMSVQMWQRHRSCRAVSFD